MPLIGQHLKIDMVLAVSPIVTYACARKNVVREEGQTCPIRRTTTKSSALRRPRIMLRSGVHTDVWPLNGTPIVGREMRKPLLKCG